MHLRLNFTTPVINTSSCSLQIVHKRPKPRGTSLFCSTNTTWPQTQRQASTALQPERNSLQIVMRDFFFFFFYLWADWWLLSKIHSVIYKSSLHHRVLQFNQVYCVLQCDAVIKKSWIQNHTPQTPHNSVGFVSVYRCSRTVFIIYLFI